jgi:nicotinate-nucleotide--dimethylbenzimidazole phosphoribosyltransferase
MLIQETLDQIKPIDLSVAAMAQQKLDSLTKPPGSLGRLEECAIKYVAARSDINAKISQPTILTFAGDHGVAAEKVSAFPQEVTPQMVANFANGGAGVNVLARHVGAKLKIIDIGVAAPCDFPGVINRKIAPGTANMAKGPAMTIEQTRQAIKVGIEEVQKAIDEGATLIGTGDMGIANTTPSAAIYSVLLGISPSETTGRGTGLNCQGLEHKVKVIEKAIEINHDQLSEPLSVLAALGGFEIAGICGTILGATSKQVPVVVDGFISGAAAVTAIKLKPEIKEYCFFSHLSAEAGHRNAMKKLGIKPLLDLGFRLGEGTGAALAFNLIEAGLKIMNEMATFDSAGVSKK